MYLLGHLGVTSAIGHIMQTKSNQPHTKSNQPHTPYLPSLLLGAMLPDIIDKPINVLTKLPGRFIAHIMLIHLIILIITRQTIKNQTRKTKITSLELGAIMHILEDYRIHDKDWLKTALFPLYGPIQIKPQSYLFLLGYKDPYNWITETIGLTLLIIIGIKRQWNKKTWNLLLLLIITYITTYTLAVIYFSPNP